MQDEKNKEKMMSFPFKITAKYLLPEKPLVSNSDFYGYNRAYSSALSFLKVRENRIQKLRSIFNGKQ